MTSVNTAAVKTPSVIVNRILCIAVSVLAVWSAVIPATGVDRAAAGHATISAAPEASPAVTAKIRVVGDRTVVVGEGDWPW